MVVRLFLNVAQAVRSLLRSVDRVLPASKCGVAAATEAAEVARLGLEQQDTQPPSVRFLVETEDLASPEKRHRRISG